jgi:hypothetical protein
MGVDAGVSAAGVTFALSSTPNAPYVTTVSPPESPDVISAKPASRTPTVTGVACAKCSASTTNT